MWPTNIFYTLENLQRPLVLGTPTQYSLVGQLVQESERRITCDLLCTFCLCRLPSAVCRDFSCSHISSDLVKTYLLFFSLPSLPQSNPMKRLRDTDRGSVCLDRCSSNSLGFFLFGRFRHVSKRQGQNYPYPAKPKKKKKNPLKINFCRPQIKYSNFARV
jgi:hypothetical protein